ncbi:MAG: small, acid-soluble spore protein, alpha/beta type [Firmicutes bacterium]|nr:small, acid-soluble spore protein, alpha/beta type [Bacillota bacterium]
MDKSKKIESQAMERLKKDLLVELGLDQCVESRGWGDISAKDCGQIGGRMSGQLSNNILRKLAAAKKPGD